ncbi:MAG TPA: DUF1653 domain-containing protein [Rhabdochlamydiaceae bacterium]|nr:DUF1653 domain-containing protein [Rhabdochlamydiaceae bacterium]HSX38689.1 DUF1653 domain-containing protein [Chlamydiales bacterium]
MRAKAKKSNFSLFFFAEKVIIFIYPCYYNPPNPPQNEELKPFSSEAKAILEGEIYEHYKGKRYKVLSVGRNSETLEETIIYQALYGTHDVWVRPLKMFSENIVINGLPQPRFKRVQ